MVSILLWFLCDIILFVITMKVAFLVIIVVVVFQANIIVIIIISISIVIQTTIHTILSV